MSVGLHLIWTRSEYYLEVGTEIVLWGLRYYRANWVVSGLVKLPRASLWTVEPLPTLTMVAIYSPIVPLQLKAWWSTNAATTIG